MRHLKGIASGLVGADGVPFTLGLTRANTTKILAGRQAMLAGTRNMIGAANGDSIDRGVDETAIPYGSQYRLSICEQLAILFRNAGIAAGANNWFGVAGTSLGDFDLRDDRFMAAGTAAMGSSVVQGGAGLSMSSATATMSFTPQENVNEVKFWSLQNSAFNGATLTTLKDGGALGTIVQDTSNTIRRTTQSLGSLGKPVITVNWTSGANALYGIECVDNTRKEISFRNWAQSGATVSQMVDNTGTPNAGRQNQMNLDPPDFVYGDGGMVNSWRNGTAVATVQTQFDAWVNGVKAAGSDFIFVTPPFDAGVAGNTANQQQYVDMGIARTLALGGVVLDVRKKWLSKANSDARGWTSAGDLVHKTIAGQADTAQMMYPLLRWAMGS